MAEALSRASTIFQKLATHGYSIGERYWVDVTHITNPESFYVRPVVFREDLEYLQETRNQLEANEIYEGKTIIYRSEFLDAFVRGHILKVFRDEGNIKCDIKAIDYGCEDHKVPIWRLRSSKEDVVVPPLAVHCTLADCISLDPQKWSEEAIEAMKSYVGNERARMTIRGRTLDQLVVELVNSCPNDIASMLTMTGYAAIGNAVGMGGSNQDNPSFEGRYFECKRVKVGDVLHVRCQIGKDFTNFYVAEVNDFKQYLKQRNDFTGYCMYQKSPRINDLVIGKGVGFKSQFMTRYERAMVKGVICPTKVVVQQIDWGDVHEATLSSLKLVKPMIFGQTTAVAIFCKLAKSQENKLEPSAFLSPGVVFIITIKEVGDNFHVPHTVEISKYSTN